MGRGIRLYPRTLDSESTGSWIFIAIFRIDQFSFIEFSVFGLEEF